MATQISNPIRDAYYMGVALQHAEKAAKRGEVPVGAVLVHEQALFSSEGNEREIANDPTAHAEILAIRHAGETLQNWRLEQSTLYITVEPCLLCTGAIYLARVPRVVFGCPNHKGGALLFTSKHERELNLNHHVEIELGVKSKECAKLLKDFFQSRRNPPAELVESA